MSSWSNLCISVGEHTCHSSASVVHNVANWHRHCFYYKTTFDISSKLTSIQYIITSLLNTEYIRHTHYTKIHRKHMCIIIQPQIGLWYGHNFVSCSATGKYHFSICLSIAAACKYVIPMTGGIFLTVHSLTDSQLFIPLTSETWWQYYHCHSIVVTRISAGGGGTCLINIHSIQNHLSFLYVSYWNSRSTDRWAVNVHWSCVHVCLQGEGGWELFHYYQAHISIWHQNCVIALFLRNTRYL